MVLPIFFNKTRELATWSPSALEGNEIIAKLGIKYQNGLVFDPNELILYMFVWAVSFVFFW